MCSIATTGNLTLLIGLFAVPLEICITIALELKVTYTKTRGKYVTGAALLGVLGTTEERHDDGRQHEPGERTEERLEVVGGRAGSFGCVVVATRILGGGALELRNELGLPKRAIANTKKEFAAYHFQEQFST